MADEDPIDARGGDIGKNKLPLRSFSRIKQEPLSIPTDQVGAVIPKSSRLLCAAAQDDDIPCAHTIPRRAKKEARPSNNPERPPMMWAVLAKLVLIWSDVERSRKKAARSRTTSKR